MIDKKKNSFFFILLFFFTALSWSQVFDKSALKIKATDLYYQGIFPNVDPALALYEDFNFTETELEEINYFKMVTALRLNDPGAVKLIETFNLDYPNNTILKTVYLDLANYYFKNEKYSYAHKWFAKVKAADVPKAALPEFYFNKGYTLFSKKQYLQAKTLLENVKFNPKYESDAHYYLGHIAYQLEDYAEASNSFTRVSKKDQMENLGYFKVEMNFKLGRFEKAISLGEKEIQNEAGENFSELSKILGESYFNTQQYDKALTHLKNYKGKKGEAGLYAVGRYQLIPCTLKGATWRIKDFDMQRLYNQELQDVLGVYLILIKRPQVRNYLAGLHEDHALAGQELAKEFASVPIQYPNSRCERGQSFYCNDKAGNAAHISLEDIDMALKEVRNRLSENTVLREMIEEREDIRERMQRFF